MTFIVSVQPFTVQMNPYVPTESSPVIVVLDDVGVVIVATDRFEDSAVHIPAPPIPAIVAVVRWHIFWSGPAFGFGVTSMSAVSGHPFSVQ